MTDNQFNWNLMRRKIKERCYYCPICGILVTDICDVEIVKSKRGILNFYCKKHFKRNNQTAYRI